MNTIVIEGKSCPSHRDWYCTEAAFTGSRGTVTHHFEQPVWQSFFNRFVQRGSQITLKVDGYKPDVGCAFYVDGKLPADFKQEEIYEPAATFGNALYVKCTYTVP